MNCGEHVGSSFVQIIVLESFRMEGEMLGRKWCLRTNRTELFQVLNA